MKVHCFLGAHFDLEGPSVKTRRQAARARPLFSVPAKPGCRQVFDAPSSPIARVSNGGLPKRSKRSAATKNRRGARCITSASTRSPSAALQRSDRASSWQPLDRDWKQPPKAAFSASAARRFSNSCWLMPVHRILHCVDASRPSRSNVTKPGPRRSTAATERASLTDFVMSLVLRGVPLSLAGKSYFPKSASVGIRR